MTLVLSMAFTGYRFSEAEASPTTVETNFSNSTSFENNTLSSCSLLPNTSCCTFAGNTFCGVNNTWEATVSKPTAIVAAVIPTLLAWIFTLRGIGNIFKYGEMYNDFLDLWNESGASRFKKIIRLFIPIILLPISKFVWDAVDVTLDCYLFYQLEVGTDLMNQVIYRNVHVNKAILAFAILGCLKIPFVIAPFGKEKVDHTKVPDGNIHEDVSRRIKNRKAYAFIVTYVVEDCCELLLEYFYIEKYFTDEPAWYMIAKDVVIACICFYTLLDALVTSCQICQLGDEYHKREGSDGCDYLYHFIPIICIGWVTAMRVAGAIYQYTIGTVKYKCFDIADGKLLQTPFQTACLREVDYAILLLMFVPVFWFPCAWNTKRNISLNMKN